MANSSARAHPATMAGHRMIHMVTQVIIRVLSVSLLMPKTKTFFHLSEVQVVTVPKAQVPMALKDSDQLLTFITWTESLDRSRVCIRTA